MVSSKMQALTLYTKKQFYAYLYSPCGSRVWREALLGIGRIWDTKCVLLIRKYEMLVAGNMVK